MSHATNQLHLPAIEIRQGPERLLYSFAVDGKLVHEFAAVSRIRRDAANQVVGYQRPESTAHIMGIREYIESSSPTIPNAVVLAFDSRVRFIPYEKFDSPVSYARMGTLVIPYEQDMDDTEKPGFIVDGQQRLAAIRDADVPSFPVVVSAFITDDIKQQTEQFILVNSTKPLPKGLIYELLPSTQALLPGLLQRRRFPAYLLDRLNSEPSSPFYMLIQTPTNPALEINGKSVGIVNHNAILKMIENSLTDGILRRYRDTESSIANAEEMLKVLISYWSAVADVFKDAWGLKPTKSRLMHGAGIVSMGFLMDTIAERYRSVGAVPGYDEFRADLEIIKEHCRWTDGYWDFGLDDKRRWNTIQNTSNDIQNLSKHLTRLYSAKVWSFSAAPTSVGLFS